MCLSRGIDIIGGSIQLAQSQAQAMRDIGSTVLITLHRNENGQQQCLIFFFKHQENKENYEKMEKLSLLFQLTKQKTGLQQLIKGDKRVVLQSWNFCKCWKKFFLVYVMASSGHFSSNCHLFCLLLLLVSGTPIKKIKERETSR